MNHWKKYWKPCLCLMLILSASGNLFLFDKLLHNHRQNWALRIDPIQAGQSLQLPATIKLLIYGDSLAEYWSVLPPIKSTINLGIGGQTSQQILLRSRSELEKVHAEWIILLAGGNDLKAVAALPEQEHAIQEQAFVNIQELLTSLPADNIALATIPPVFSLPLKYHAVDFKTAQQTQQMLNQRIRGLASERVHILDLYALFSQQTNISSYSDDGIHPNKKGYQLINDELNALISNKLTRD